MGILSFSRKTPHLVRCDYCHRPSHNVYYANIDGIKYCFCSGAHMNEAVKNYKTKKQHGFHAVEPELEIEENDNQTDAG